MSTSAGDRPRFRATLGITLVIAFLSMFGPFTVDTVFPAFAHIGAQFDVSSAAMQQVTSTYLLSFGLMSLLHGPVSDAVGRKPVMVVGILVYVLASIGCALSVNLPMLLAFRILQGASAGAGQIISRAVIRDMFAGAAAQRLMAQVSMIFAVAPAIAPIMGGWMLRVGRWPVIFWFLAAFGLAMAAWVLVGLHETHPQEARTPLRLRPILTGMADVARHGSFMRLAFAGAAGFAAQFLYIAAAPIFVVDLLGKGDQDFWIFFVPIITGMMLGSWLNSRTATRLAPHQTVMIGLSVALGAAVVNTLLAAFAPHLPWAVLGPAFIALGVAFAFPVLQLVMLDLFPERRGSAASVQAFVALMINAALAGIVAPLVTSSILTLALTSLGFSIVGMALWLWHVARTNRRA